MDARQYERWSAPLRENPRMARAVIAANKALTCLGYAIYPLLLAILAITGSPFLAKAVLIPAGAFLALSAFRTVFNAPRPYEVLDIEPLIAKDTKGKSFPSRHAFSMAMIALTWLAWCAPVGIALLVATAGMAVVRVMGGVHFPKDVAAGIAFALVASLFFWIL